MAVCQGQVRSFLGETMRSLLLMLYLSIAATLLFLCLILFQEFSTPKIPAGSLGEPVYLAPKNKISFSGGEFMKIGQATGLTFTLSEARTVSHKELQCLAKNIYHEARGEGIAGMMGIAQITLNRADSQHRGKKTLCGVVHDTKQFSWTSDTKTNQKRLDKASWQQSLHIAQLVLLGVRIKEIEDSLYFHSHKIKNPKWTKDLSVNKQIGQHVYLGM